MNRRSYQRFLFLYYFRMLVGACGSDKVFDCTERSSQGQVKKIMYVKIKIIITFTQVFLLTKSATVADFCTNFPS